MVTSLANFRSDYTIVHVPSGNFLDVREQLYSNVNLLRMGCGGRAALTLEEPRYVYSSVFDHHNMLLTRVFEVMRLRTASSPCTTLPTRHRHDLASYSMPR